MPKIHPTFPLPFTINSFPFQSYIQLFSGSFPSHSHEPRVPTEPLRVNPGHAAPSENPPRCANCPFPISPISLFPPAAFWSRHFQSRAQGKAVTPARIFPLLVPFQDNRHLRGGEIFLALFLWGKAPVAAPRAFPSPPNSIWGCSPPPNSLGTTGIPQNNPGNAVGFGLGMSVPFGMGKEF